MDIQSGINCNNSLQVEKGIISSTSIFPSAGIIYDALGTIVFDADGTPSNTTMAVNDTRYPVNVVTAPSGKLYGLTSNNDGSLTNASGKTLILNGVICADALCGVVDTHLGAETDESGSWAEIQTDRGSWRASIYSNVRAFTWVCAYNISLSNGKSIRPVCQNDASAPQTFGVYAFSHHAWSLNAD